MAKRRGRVLFGYSSDPYGQPDLRAAIARLVTLARGLSMDAESVFITRGSQMALDLVARSLIRAGDVVAVEAHGYHNAVKVFGRAGAEVVPVPVDRPGAQAHAGAGRAVERELTANLKIPASIRTQARN